ncbi:MAG: C39 family peptidase [Elusimicrobiota bacterium]
MRRRGAAFLLLAMALQAAPRAEAGVTVVHVSPLDLQGARIEGLAPLPFEKGLLQGTGALESPVIETAFHFDDLVGSWNADTPRGASVEMDAQARQGGKWSKWYRLSRWEPGAPKSFDRQRDANGFVAVDTLKLSRPADAFRYRIRMTSAGAREARLTRVAVAYESISHPPPPSPPFEKGPWVRELKVAPRSQMEQQKKYRRDICSPTALAMVLEYWGVKRDTLEVAEAVRDTGAGIYGNWPFNVAAAAAYGLAGQVARLPSLNTLQDEIAAGRPVVVSITFKEGELTGAPLPRSRGHLLVVTGFTARGDVIVNDPAAPTRKTVRRVYRRSQLEKAWLQNKNGLAYMLSERFPLEAVVGVPTADLRARPRASRRLSATDPARRSQLLYGERVRILEAKGDWVRVLAVEQQHHPKPGSWGGYPGWMRADALRIAPIPYHPNAVIRAKRAELRWLEAQGLEESLTLPLGTALLAGTDRGARTDVLLLDGRTAHVDSGALLRLDAAARPPPDGRDVLEAAALFLGDRYVWGGRSSLQPKPGWGLDCSGLVQLAYRSVGISVPRDAHAQYLKARPVRRRRMLPGDAVFLTESARSKRVNHVLLYTGGDGLLESRSSAGRTLRTTFVERFGRPLTGMESGDRVTDRTRKKPLRRRIYFGSFLSEP